MTVNDLWFRYTECILLLNKFLKCIHCVHYIGGFSLAEYFGEFIFDIFEFSKATNAY